MKKFKIKLSSGKTVLLRELQVGDQETAAEAAGLTANTSPMVAAMKVQNELIKLLIEQIDGKEVPKQQLEFLKDLFTFAEFSQLVGAITELTVAEGKPTIEILSA